MRPKPVATDLVSYTTELNLWNRQKMFIMATVLYKMEVTSDFPSDALSARFLLWKVSIDFFIIARISNLHSKLLSRMIQAQNSFEQLPQRLRIWIHPQSPHPLVNGRASWPSLCRLWWRTISRSNGLAIYRGIYRHYTATYYKLTSCATDPYFRWWNSGPVRELMMLVLRCRICQKIFLTRLEIDKLLNHMHQIYTIQSRLWTFISIYISVYRTFFTSRHTANLPSL